MSAQKKATDVEDIEAIPWDWDKQRMLLTTPRFFTDGFAGITEDARPILQQETASNFLGDSDEKLPRLATREEQSAVGTGKTKCPMCQRALVITRRREQHRRSALRSQVRLDE
jgi:hypothetical protein